MPQTEKKMLVTIALPYANGDLHLGHLVEAIQADIWVRFQKMQKNICYFIAGDDAHGTAIMLAAEKQGITPEEFITQIKQRHEADFQDFMIGFDLYGSTHTPENQRFAEMIYRKLKDKNFIFKQAINQYFDLQANLFLPDRFIRGTCPKCAAKNQYGDNCESCGAVYSPADLKDCISVVSGTTPVIKQTEHLFFDLPAFAKALKTWVHQEKFQPSIKNKLHEWFESGLKPWDITRDKPYFGFPIPDNADQYFYVWMDAPIAYMSIFKQLCYQQKLDFSAFWHPEGGTELYHFIGKDIMYFHTLFWPAMLMGADLKTPDNIFVHGFLTIDGQKMSKSRGTYIQAQEYKKHLNPEFLRYYFAAKLNENIEDIDLNLTDFIARINSDLIGKVINIASRCCLFINKYFNHTLSRECINIELFEEFVVQGEIIAGHYQHHQYSRAVKEIMRLADKANQYIDEQKPWALIKDPDSQLFVQEICSMGLNLFLLLITYLKPILPKTAQNTEKLFNLPDLTFEDREKPLINHVINLFEPLLQRVTEDQINALRAAAQSSADISQPISQDIKNTPVSVFPEISPEISYEDFAKIDLRIGKIIHAEHVEGADKLLKLIIDLGTALGKRQIFAGIKSAYTPESLIGKLTVIAANLAPRKMRFGVSEGMILAAGNGGKEVFILQPGEGAECGMRVK